MREIQNKQPIEEDEIDLIQLAKEVWDGRKLVIKTTVVFMVIGLFVALLTPEQYQVTSIVVPQTSGAKNKLGGLSSLAAMAGFNLNMSSGGTELSPMIYPQIVQSVPFKKALMQTKLNFKDIDHPVTYYDYFTKYAKPGVLSYITGFPGMIMKAIRGKQKQSFERGDTTRLIRLSQDEKSLAEGLTNTVYANVDEKNGYITLTAIMPEALAAAELDQRAQELLQQFVTKIKIKKARAQLDFIQERYNAKMKEFDSAQMALARFRDQNKNISTALAQSQEERLSNNYQLIYGVYSELAKQLENARIQVKDDSPVFSVIEPVTIPNERFKPKRKQILIIWTFMGIIIGIGWVFGKKYFEKVKEEWNKKGE